MVRLLTLYKKYLAPSGFQIYNASAGSGKTYQLAKSYITKLVSKSNEPNFGQLLALTFTNKAVAEMKQRILENLQVFGNPDIDKSSIHMFQEIKKELGTTKPDLEQRCALTLKLLLHNYGFFEISTIDKFTHKIIKTFAKDLKIAQNFEVELDTDLLLDQAIGRLFSRIGDDEKLAKILIDFSLEKIDVGRSWNIVFDLKQIGKILFEEVHYDSVQELKFHDDKDFKKLKSFLKDKISVLEGTAVKQAELALKTIYDMGFEDNDFSRGTLPNHFKKIISGETNTSPLYKNKLEEYLIADNVTLKTVAKDATELCAQLLPIYLDVKQLLHQRGFLTNASKNVVPLMVLSEIAKEVANLHHENEILHISEFNKLISQEIKDQPVPYIYERLGEKYRHYYIDEFQDTSKMQWNNLVPLIGNALETENLSGEKGSLLLVGDVKQSIYRWRGGDPNQFLALGNLRDNPFTVEPNVHTLEKNWRSFDRIVNFNNDFFTHISSSLEKEDYQKLYLGQCQQQLNFKEGGYVEISFLDQSGAADENPYCAPVLETIGSVLDNGFNYGDICILVRRNKDGVLLADFLAQNNIPVVSSEALLLKNSAKVIFLVALLGFINDPEEKAFQFEILEYLSVKSNIPTHDYITKHLGQLAQLLKTVFGFDIEKAKGNSVLNIMEQAITKFQLPMDANAFVIHFLDTVIEVEEKVGVGVHDFLNFWNLKKDSLAIAAPEKGNAVRLMSIHKSKGLEFRFVIFPFADTKINDRTKQNKVWVPLEDNEGPNIAKVLVNTSKALEYYSKESIEIYEKENALAELDDINVLYVALTRAIEGLFIITQEKKGVTYASLFKEYLTEKGLWAPNEKRYRFGEFLPNKAETTLQLQPDGIPYIKRLYKETSSMFAINSQLLWDTEQKEATNRGTIIHSLLSDIKTAADIDKALENGQQRGDVPLADQAIFRKIILEIVNHNELAAYYSGNKEFLNEIELMTPNGSLHRPDRLVVEENKITVIDYKTGAKKAEHQNQISAYASILEEMGYIVINKILIYIGKQIEPVFL